MFVHRYFFEECSNFDNFFFVGKISPSRWSRSKNFLNPHVVNLSVLAVSQSLSARADFSGPGPGSNSSLLQARPVPFEKSPFICRPGPTSWKNHLSFACPARPVGKITSHLPGRVRASDPCRPLI